MVVAGEKVPDAAFSLRAIFDLMLVRTVFVYYRTEAMAIKEMNIYRSKITAGWDG